MAESLTGGLHRVLSAYYVRGRCFLDALSGPTGRSLVLSIVFFQKVLPADKVVGFRFLLATLDQLKRIPYKSYNALL